MKKQFCLPLAIGGLVCSVFLFGIALLLRNGIPDSIGGLGFGLTGALFGVSATAVIKDLFSRRLTPEEHKELDRGERDERNVAIREKAAMSSWRWSLGLLWALFIVSLSLKGTCYIALSASAIILHCVFYMVNMGRWAKKL